MTEEKPLNKSWGWSIPDILLERTDLDMAEKVLITIMGRLGALEKPIYPRQKWLAEKMGMSERGVRKVLKRLENKNIIKYEGRNWKIAKYSLTGTEFLSSQEQSSFDSQEGSSSHKKDIHSKDIHINNNTKVLATELLINGFISKFKNINPSYKKMYSNKTQRACLSRLIEEHGKEKIESLLNLLPKVNVMPYAPIITTPYELEEKLAKLLLFIKKRSDEFNKNKITKIQ